MSDEERRVVLAACIEKLRRFECDGVTNQPTDEGERILVDPALWHDGLVAYATFHSIEGRA